MGGSGNRKGISMGKVKRVEWSRELSELLSAAADVVEQVGAFIDLDDRVDDPRDHDLYDVLVNLQSAIISVDGDT